MIGRRIKNTPAFTGALIYKVNPPVLGSKVE